ncbi:hypothetical protein [Stenomitos frigidus]|uniref:DUF1579 domain-containing protein n=1 Tax=Stenomitos frigidus ULC18 TaxID=2107698 RepID=A0A2T1DYJ0_9CYAN|nr:hypothetical protein [Stenomitos frigidus]PSB25577.1 hypothetical protein C7B82_22415 [Stenomitos frigidus ULC18]
MLACKTCRPHAYCGSTCGDRVCLVASAIALTLAVFPAYAAEPPTSALPKPDPQLEQLQYFQGKWLCVVKPVGAPANRPAEPFTWEIKRELNNFWFLGQVSTKQNIAITHDTLGYNTLTKRFGRTILTGDGQFINLLSEGWSDDKWVWEGSVVRGTQRNGLRQTIVKTGDRAFEAAYEQADLVKKDWQPVLKETCRKASEPI